VSAQVQYLRQFSLVIGGPDGSGLEFSEFRVTFTIRRGDYQTPNSADIRIYNLSANTANLIQKEFTLLSLSAGYPGNIGLIFRGNIKQVRKGRIDQKDSYVDVTAADGDEAYNFTPINTSLKAGTTPGGVYQALVTAFKQKGLTQGYAPNLTQSGSVRGCVLYGTARDEMRRFANDNECSWSIQNGNLTLIPLTSYIPGNVITITPSTGLIGVPEQTQNGLQMRVLLNPNIKIGQVVKLDSSDINKLRFGLTSQGQQQANNIFLNKQVLNTANPDGLYFVMVANHTGDTRGRDWYTDMTCLAVDATVPSADALNALFALGDDAIKPFN
jgi:hypothetical protein